MAKLFSKRLQREGIWILSDITQIFLDVISIVPPFPIFEFHPSKKSRAKIRQKSIPNLRIWNFFRRFRSSGGSGS